MTAATAGSIILTLAILAIFIAIVVYLMNWLYRRSSTFEQFRVRNMKQEIGYVLYCREVFKPEGKG